MISVENDPLVDRFRCAAENPAAISLAWIVQTKADVTQLLEELAIARLENDRLRKIAEFIELKRENEELKAKLAESVDIETYNLDVHGRHPVGKD